MNYNRHRSTLIISTAGLAALSILLLSSWFGVEDVWNLFPDDPAGQLVISLIALTFVVLHSSLLFHVVARNRREWRALTHYQQKLGADGLRKNILENLEWLAPESCLVPIMRKLTRPGNQATTFIPWMDRYLEERLQRSAQLARWASLLPVLGLIGSLVGIIVHILPDLKGLDLSEPSSVQRALVNNVFIGMLVAFTTTFWGIIAALHVHITLNASERSDEALVREFKDTLHDTIVPYLLDSPGLG